MQFAYDFAGRLSTRTTPAGALHYGYDASTGKLGGITGPGSSLAFTYDGSLPLSVRWSGEVTGSVEVAYDDNLWVTRQTVNGADTVGFTYDKDGLLTGAGALILSRSPQNGLLTGSSLGGVSERLAYDGYGELSGDTVTQGGGVLFARSYVRDALGRIQSLSESAGGGATVQYAFAYDSVGRLREVKRDGVAVESYEYDANGNRLRAITPNGVLVGSYDAQDRLLSYGDASYGYTRAGELAWKAVGADTTRYTYDVLGNLRRVELPDGQVIEYVIDPQNRRVGKKVDGVLVQGLLYGSQLAPVAELDGSGQVVSRFVYATQVNVPDYMEKGGRRYRLVTDHLGSVRRVVEVESGAVVQDWSTTASGG